MKRSEVNAAIQKMEAVLKEHRYILPPFCNLTPEEWKNCGPEYDEIRECMLGWDITDNGSGDFEKDGLCLITVRNGSQANPKKYPKPYAEKIMFIKEGQTCPTHFHWYKTEDIINRGGGNLMIRMNNSTADEKVDTTGDVIIHQDGVVKTVPAGTVICLHPGESIWIMQGQYHSFWAEPGTGDVLIGEVSQCNDDNTDNCFAEPRGRYPEIIEDEAPYRLLCNEYPNA